MGGYEDWPSYLRWHPRHIADSPAGQELADALGVPAAAANSGLVLGSVALESEETHDGVTTSRVSWQLGFGPRTRAWFLRPAGPAGPLPGILALHCHAGIKSVGAERLVDPRLVDSGIQISALQQNLYGGRPFATWLASRGFAVLAHDAFSWGSRRFDLDTPPWRTAAVVNGRKALWREAGVVPSEADLYDAAAAAHEDTVAKAAGLLGTSFAGMVAHDDLAALRVLSGLTGVDAARLGTVGFSGGGGRSLMLAALSPLVRSFVVTCMMTTYRSLFPSYVDAHSWLLQTPGLSRLGDYPELAARSTADRFLVQYALADELFPEDGMRDADALLRAQNASGRYTGSFRPGGHAFTTDMQEEAAGFLLESLSPARQVFARQNGPS
ncbi:acetylesterase [Arthrobacter oryzae]|uniref:acetylesterase n=1 Tax=Arthrobacter oryzae TaxID=409290 RepID=UPI00286B2329|nr:acetylesterase [Arthrobacter oryzae]